MGWEGMDGVEWDDKGRVTSSETDGDVVGAVQAVQSRFPPSGDRCEIERNGDSSTGLDQACEEGRAEEKHRHDEDDEVAEEDEEDEEGEEQDVVLGFLEVVTDESERFMTRDHFPTKVGGRAAWLDPNLVPTAQDVTCDRCGVRMHFLLQMYCPLEEVEHAFHRTLYIFVCMAKDCGGVRGLRAQLPRSNSFYPSEYDEEVEAGEEALCHLCALCSLKATKRCGKCSASWYCSRACQQTDWRLGHSRVCCTAVGSGSDLDRRRKKWRFPHLEICMEREEEASTETPGGSDPATALRAELKPKTATMQSATLDELHEENFSQADPDLVKFQARVASAPAQTIRYRRNGRVLWPFSEGKLDSKPPSCPRCGASRTYELQVLPQLLYFLRKDELDFDFATLVMYTCKDSCKVEGYAEEYVYRQPPSVM